MQRNLSINLLLKITFLCYFTIPIFGQNKKLNDKLKIAIEQITKANQVYLQKKDFILKSNPLQNNRLFIKYKAKSYLYFYQALGFYLVSQHPQYKDSLMLQSSFLKKSLRSLEKSSAGPIAPQEEILEWGIKIRLAILERESIQKHSKRVERLARKVLQDDPDNKKALLYLIAALYQMNKSTERQKLLMEPSSQEILTDKILAPFQQQIKQDLIEIKILEAKMRVGKRSVYSKDSLIQRNIKAILRSTQEQYYNNNEFEEQFKKVTELYTDCKQKKTKLSKLGQKFVMTIENNLDKFKLEDLIKTAKILWYQSRWYDSQQLFSKLEKIFKQPKDLAELVYNRALLYERSNLFKAAKKSYTRLSLIAKDNPYQELAYYKVAQLAYIREEKNTDNLFKNYLRQYNNGKFDSAARYFYLNGKLKKLTKTKTKERKSLEKEVVSLFEEHLLSYYSILLSKDFPELYKNAFYKILHQQKNNKQVNQPPTQKLALYSQCIKELFNFSLAKHARDLLLQLSLNSTALNERLYLVHLNKEMQHYSGSIINSIRIFYDHKDNKDLIQLQDIFPYKHTDLIDSTLKKYKENEISTLFVLSLIRQESAFDPYAHSLADAMGLMQLIPSTASYMAKKAELKEFSIFNPEDNILLGIGYLRKLLRDFSKNPVYTLSAYNAGPNKVKKWVQERGKLDKLRFVETIPYKETSNYVKLIARNYTLYQLLYQKDPKQKLRYLF